MKKNIKINWKPFWKGRSSIDALHDFIDDKIRHNWCDWIVDPDLLKEVEKLNKLPIQVARNRAIAALKRSKN